MLEREQRQEFDSLELPTEFEDLEGLIQTDLQAIVTMLTERAHDRLFLTRREHRQLQANLWNEMARVIGQSLQPLQVECR